MKKIICPQCQKIVDVDKENEIIECKECKKSFSFESGITFTKLYIKRLFKTANQYESNAFSYKEAYECYEEILLFDPNNLDAILGKLLNMIKMSTFKNNYLIQFINEFNTYDIILENKTYIRIGHFFEEVYKAVYKYYSFNVSLLEMCNEKEKEIIYKNFLEIEETYKLINENINLFTDTEYNDSIYISKEVIFSEEEQIKKYINDSQIYKISKQLNDTIIYTNDSKIIYKDFNIENYNDIVDLDVFKINKSTNTYKAVFMFLILFFIVAFIGFILLLTQENKIIGYTLLGSGIGLFGITYLLFLFFRKKQINNLTK